MVHFAPVREFPGERGFWNLSLGRDAAAVEAPTAQTQGGISMCHVLIGIIVFMLLFWMLSNSSSCGRYGQKFVNSMRANMKKEDTANTVDHHIKVDNDLARKTLCRPGDKNCVTNITECVGDDCKDIKTVSPDFKKKADKNVTEFLNKNKTCMVMIYAPWCPHCHTAMPKFFEASKKAKCPFAIINAELVSPQLLQGENSLFNVQFFPFIIRRDQKGSEVSDTVYKGAPTVEGYVKHSEMDKMDHFFA